MINRGTEPTGLRQTGQTGAEHGPWVPLPGRNTAKVQSAVSDWGLSFLDNTNGTALRRGYTQSLQRTPSAPATARGLIRIALGAWDLDLLIERGELVVSELVANAVLHTHGPHIVVSITRPSCSVVRVAVTDMSHERPVLRDAGETDEHGRGIALVNTLTDTWGTTLDREGKAVWGEMGTELHTR